jgi:hypothetical protein
VEVVGLFSFLVSGSLFSKSRVNLFSFDLSSFILTSLGGETVLNFSGGCECVSFIIFLLSNRFLSLLSPFLSFSSNVFLFKANLYEFIYFTWEILIIYYNFFTHSRNVLRYFTFTF